MASLKLIDTKDKFLLKLALSVANVEKVEIVSDKITEESRRE